MGIDFPSSLTASTGQKFTYSGQEYEFNGTAWRKVKDRVTSFNGATGAIIGVTSVQGKTGDVTLTDLEITHGVETFNGLSGSIDTTSLILPVTGISASGGITSNGGIVNVSTTKKLKVGVPGTGFGSGPFTPLTYSFPTTPTAADSDGKNPQILVQNTAIVPSSGDIPLSFAKIGDFTVNSFNGVTGDLEGVTAFNGLTGNVDTTSLVLPVAGISASGGITCGGTAEANNFVVDGGKISQKGNESTTHIDFSSAQDVKIKSADDINLEPADSLNISLGNDTADGVKFTGSQTLNFFTAGAKFLTVSDDVSNVILGDIGEVTSNSKITINDQFITITESGGSVVETFDQNYKRHVDVATFTISASSAIATGKKTDSLYRLPYNATLKNVDVKVSATGGFTAGMFIAGSDFGLPTTGSLTGATLGVSGLTASSTSFDVTTLTGGNFLFFDVINNDSGSTQAQMFVTFESR